MAPRECIPPRIGILLARICGLEHATSVSSAIPRLFACDHDGLLVRDAGVSRCACASNRRRPARRTPTDIARANTRRTRVQSAAICRCRAGGARAVCRSAVPRPAGGVRLQLEPAHAERARTAGLDLLTAAETGERRALSELFDRIARGGSRGTARG